MNTNISHTATNTRIEFGASTITNSSTRVDEIGVHTPHVIINRKHFKDPVERGRSYRTDFFTEDIHLTGKYDVQAKVVESDAVGTHVVVKIEEHVTMYLPLNFAHAIADAANEYDLDSLCEVDSVA
jgi:hypothetical protein